jgi:TRAP-type C4-dicarboxylate transport system substrate-binding protein
MQKTEFLTKGLSAIALAGVLAALPPSARAADGDKTYVMKLSTATINDAQHEWMKNFAAAAEKDSGGRLKGEIYPASQLGSIPRQIEGTQFGSIQAWIGPPEFLVGVDERFEVMTASGLVQDLQHGVRIAQDPELAKVILDMGGDKGLLGVCLFISAPSSITTRKPVRHLAEFKGLKIRVLASAFANEEINRLGATPVAMTLGDVLPAIQQGALDGAVAQVAVFTTMQYFDAAKYITETGHNYIFSVAEFSKKWFEALPPDLQKIIRDDAQKAALAINPWEAKFFEEQRKVWVDKGGELIRLPPEEHAAMMESLVGVGDDLSKSKPALHDAYEALVAAAQRTKQ